MATAELADLRSQLQERRARLGTYSRWEQSQPLQPYAGRGASAAARLDEMLSWYDDAYEFAASVGSLGPAAPNQHLEDMMVLAERIRRAWPAT
jgi:hypothetical protein